MQLSSGCVNLFLEVIDKLERYDSGLSMTKVVTCLTVKFDDSVQALKILPALISNIRILNDKLAAQEIRLAHQDTKLLEL